MNILIKRVQESDLPDLGKLITAIKFAQSINRLLWKNWPDQDLQQEQSLGSVTHAFNDQASDLFKAVDGTSGEIYGFVIFTLKSAVAVKSESTNESNPGDGAAPDIPARFNREVILAVMQAMSKISKETESIDHLEVAALAVQPHHQRKGIGSQLMKVGFDRARIENVPIVVRSEPTSNEFFMKKHHFKETKHVDFDLSKWTFSMSGYGIYRLTGMIWNP